jgi:hypothetical protein
MVLAITSNNLISSILNCLIRIFSIAHTPRNYHAKTALQDDYLVPELGSREFVEPVERSSYLK